MRRVAPIPPSAHERLRIIGAALKGWRRELGFSIDDVAFRMGLDRSTVNRVETGRIRSSYDTVERYANLLGRQVADLPALPERELRRVRMARAG